MYSIAICDDIKHERETIFESVKMLFPATSQPPCAVVSYESAPDLLADIERGRRFDLFLLDVVMPEQNGIELGKTLRRAGQPCDIIYLTVSREYAADAFDVEALGYLLKPVDTAKLQALIQKALRRQEHPVSDPVITRQTSDGPVSIHWNKVLYIENRKNLQYFILAGGSEIVVRDSITQLEQELKGLVGYLRPRYSYIVNMQGIVTVQVRDMLMSNGHRIPLVKNTFRKISRGFMDYKWRER